MITTAELVRQACPKIAGIGPGFYFVPETLQVGKELGLDGFRFYFLGRGGVLGDVEPDGVSCAFGYFNPPVVAHMWTTGRARTELGPREVGRRYLECADDFGRRHLTGVAGLAEFCAAAERVDEAVDRAGLALYAGIAAEPLPEDPPARAMRLCAALREFRGSAHLVAILATPGITPRLAHAVRRPDFWTFFGYDPADLPAATDSARAALAAADELTDALVAPAYDVLDEAGRRALLDGLTAIDAAMPERVMPSAADGS